MSSETLVPSSALASLFSTGMYRLFESRSLRPPWSRPGHSDLAERALGSGGPRALPRRCPGGMPEDAQHRAERLRSKRATRRRPAGPLSLCTGTVANGAPGNGTHSLRWSNTPRSPQRRSVRTAHGYAVRSPGRARSTARSRSRARAADDCLRARLSGCRTAHVNETYTTAARFIAWIGCGETGERVSPQPPASTLRAGNGRGEAAHGRPQEEHEQKRTTLQKSFCRTPQGNLSSGGPAHKYGRQPQGVHTTVDTQHLLCRNHLAAQCLSYRTDPCGTSGT